MEVAKLDLLSDDVELSLPEKVLFQKLDKEVVLLNVENGEYYGLNEVGSKLWTFLQQGLAMSCVVRALLEEYEVTEDQLQRDLRAFLSTLLAKGLIEVNAQGSA